MGKFGLTYGSDEFDISGKPTIVGMVEPALRTMVFVAQVQAGMWRRNRDSLNSQVFVYHAASFRKQILDQVSAAINNDAKTTMSVLKTFLTFLFLLQDVIMVQWAAALWKDPNDFLVNFIHKFQLVQWAQKDFVCSEDDSIRQLTSLVEEFLGALSVILGERYTPGVGQVTVEDAVRQEIIQLLCVEPMSHSALNKNLTVDLVTQETGMEKVVESVATFKKPNSGTGRGMMCSRGKENFIINEDG